MRPLRNPLIQKAVAWLLSQWMAFCYATLRWQRENEGVAEEVWDQGGGVLAVFWHSRLGLAPASWPHGRAQPAKGLISLSPDGQFLARAMARLGFPAIRGSSANKDKSQQAKGGTQALRDGLRQLKTGGLAITPDGPRGPANVMAPGLPTLARMSGAPVLLIGVSCNPAIRLNSWDRAVLPLPFGKGAVVWDRVDWPEDGDMEAVTAEWTDRLNAVEARADRLTGLNRDAA
ncbi:MAG: lysophospholipid acyltransferase family protein [Brevundimonas sp.]|uniref:lysophospholipid acyltransferase family protein n=1 Tax=Brevundimonas sp. TaxID=1871086 RepID=UPI00273548A8|nr:lysophospholipid acyltransferase family protein [Brevundimonas sp.]MDP3376994.1 lysophospholipid acyltransferase family protein [Brevundimonas sp.]